MLWFWYKRFHIKEDIVGLESGKKEIFILGVWQKKNSGSVQQHKSRKSLNRAQFSCIQFSEDDRKCIGGQFWQLTLQKLHHFNMETAQIHMLTPHSSYTVFPTVTSRMTSSVLAQLDTQQGCWHPSLTQSQYKVFIPPAYWAFVWWQVSSWVIVTVPTKTFSSRNC